jgi:hypothetical protein
MPPELKEGTKKAGTSGKRKGGFDSSKKDTAGDRSPDDKDVASILLHFKQST